MFSTLKAGGRAWYGIMAFILVTAGNVHAQTTLADALAAAYSRHPDRDLAVAEHNLAAALKTQADQPFAADPAFTLRHDTDAVGSDDGYREWEGGVELPLWWPGQRAARRLEAERTGATAEAMAAAKRLEVAGEVRERLWAVALARSGLADAELAHRSARKLQQDIGRRVAAGELPRSDLLLARQETLSREDEVQQADNRVRQVERRFRTFTGLEAIPQARAEAVPGSRELNPDHPVLALAATGVDKARAHRDRVTGERRAGPSLWLGGKNTRDMAGADYHSAVALEVSIPFGSAAQTAPAEAEAQAALDNALAEHGRARLAVEQALEQAELELERTARAVDQAERQQALADESLRLNRRAFELGETDLVRLLKARGDAIAARHALEARKLEAGQATARLNQALGVIPQ